MDESSRSATDAKKALHLLAGSAAATAPDVLLPIVFTYLREGKPMTGWAWNALVEAVRADRLFFIAGPDSLERLARKKPRCLR